MKKSKYRIYTVTARKNYGRFAFLIICLVVFVSLIKIMPPQGSRVYNLLIKKSVGNILLAKTEESVFTYNKNHIKIHNILNKVSPVFAGNEKSVFLLQNKNATNKAIVQAKEKTQKVTVKTIKQGTENIKNETTYDIDVDALEKLPRTYSATGKEPKVLVIHTHGCETYSDKNGIGIGENGEYRTTDTQKNMVKIGEVITDVLRTKGINVIHDKTLCDYPKYNSSYVKSLEIIEDYLARYPSIEFVFDIHRDAIAANDGTATKLICNINGKDTAQAMIVCGTDSLGLDNPNWQENLSLALKIQKNIDDKYPGLMRPVNVRKERFNMHKTKGSLLFEVGSHGNTLEEAMLGARYLAEGVADVIR